MISLAKEDILFRNNSLATRMFKFYSKMIGIEYLFGTFARYVAELDFVDQRARRATGSEGITLTEIDIEVGRAFLLNG